jgi:hypothetical protein
MKTYILVLFFTLLACNQNESSQIYPNVEEELQITKSVLSNATYGEEPNLFEEIKTERSKPFFENDDDVLMYLLGKTFRSNKGTAQISFSSDSVTVSGKNYHWQSHVWLGGHKGVVKLVSTSVDRPNDVLTLWVSCKENAITDGKMVLMY